MWSVVLVSDNNGFLPHLFSSSIGGKHKNTSKVIEVPIVINPRIIIKTARPIFSAPEAANANKTMYIRNVGTTVASCHHPECPLS
jgi:hypothetical protein